MPRKYKSKDEHEAELTAGPRDAATWLKRHEHELPPEELPVERVTSEVEGKQRARARLLFNPTLSKIPDGEETPSYDEANMFVPLMGQEYVVDIESIAKSKRVRRALDSMPAEQVELLMARCIEGLTLNELATHGESRQAVHQRLDRAKDRFAEALLEQEDDPITLYEEDF